MADIIEINIGTLATDIESMQTELANLRDDIRIAFEALAELDTMWDGPANEAFNQAAKNDHELLNQMCDIIKGLISYMENARDEYRKCENAVSAEIDTIRI